MDLSDGNKKKKILMKRRYKGTNIYEAVTSCLYRFESPFVPFIVDLRFGKILNRPMSHSIDK